jgi:hypothetical protein
MLLTHFAQRAIGPFKALGPCKLQSPQSPKSKHRDGTDPGNSSVPDPLVMSPFLVGDFVTFSGIRRGNEVIAFSIVAQNVMITTFGDLVYLRMELGLLGIDNVSPNTEIAESRVSTTERYWRLRS